MVFEIDIRKEVKMIIGEKKDDYIYSQCISYVENYFLRKISETLKTSEYLPEDSLFSGSPELFERVQDLLSNRVDKLVNQVLSKVDVSLFKNGGKFMRISSLHGYDGIDYLVDEYREVIDILFERASIAINHCKIKPTFTIRINAGYHALIIMVYANS